MTCKCGNTPSNVHQRTVGTAHLTFDVERCTRCEKKTLSGAVCEVRTVLAANRVDPDDELNLGLA